MPAEGKVRLWLQAGLIAALAQLGVGLLRTLVAAYADLPAAEQALFFVERGPGFIVAFPLVATVSRWFPEPLLMLRQIIYPASALGTWLIYAAAVCWFLRRRLGKFTKPIAGA
jgi:hypothetical protein